MVGGGVAISRLLDVGDPLAKRQGELAVDQIEQAHLGAARTFAGFGFDEVLGSARRLPAVGLANSREPRLVPRDRGVMQRLVPLVADSGGGVERPVERVDGVCVVQLSRLILRRLQIAAYRFQVFQQEQVLPAQPGDRKIHLQVVTVEFHCGQIRVEERLELVILPEKLPGELQPPRVFLTPVAVQTQIVRGRHRRKRERLEVRDERADAVRLAKHQRQLPGGLAIPASGEELRLGTQQLIQPAHAGRALAVENVVETLGQFVRVGRPRVPSGRGADCVT